MWAAGGGPGGVAEEAGCVLVHGGGRIRRVQRRTGNLERRQC
jgi:hypothetical protein